MTYYCVTFPMHRGCPCLRSPRAEASATPSQETASGGSIKRRYGEIYRLGRRGSITFAFVLRPIESACGVPLTCSVACGA